MSAWVPCKERLPYESGKYIITAFDGIVKRTTVADFQKNFHKWDLRGHRAFWNVIAWLPMPEPYKEENGE